MGQSPKEDYTRAILFFNKPRCFGISIHTDKKYFIAIAIFFYNAFIYHILIVIQCIMIACFKQK